MKPSEMPYNMDCKVDKETLRELPEDREQMTKGVEFLFSKLGEDGLSNLQSAALMTQIGIFSRVLGDLDRSEEMLVNAQNLFEQEGQAEQVISLKFRVACTLAWKEKFTKSEKLFKEGLKKLEGIRSKKAAAFKDFGIFNYGRMKFQQQQYKRALDLFLTAHEMRLIGGDLEKISKTEEAIAICRQRLESEE